MKPGQQTMHLHGKVVMVECRECAAFLQGIGPDYDTRVYNIEVAGWRWHSGAKATKGWRCPKHANPKARRQIPHKRRDMERPAQPKGGDDDE